MATAPAMSEFECDIFKSEPSSDPTYNARTISELDVSDLVLEDLALKTLYLAGSLSVIQLANRMKLSHEVANELFFRLRNGLLCQVTGSTCNIPQIAITTLGRSRAADLLSQNRYEGAAPVSFERYAALVKKQSVQRASVHLAEVQRAFGNLVIDNQTLRQLGTALNSRSSLFLYGPPGVGKTTIAETLSRVLAEDAVWIPYAVEVDGQIMTVFDPSIHKEIIGSEPTNHDARWVICHRPAVLVGGELTAEMLDLQFNAVSKYYVAPAQLKANNGVLIIDDFGRQRIRPDELLNRWIVPLDRRIDYLTLSGGRKIEVPFEMLVVFASNLDPAELVDPSFLRRIQTKIRIGEVTDEQFCEIFRRVAAEENVIFEPNIPMDLIRFIHEDLKQELRSCYPRDIVNQVCWAARFDDREPVLDRVAFEEAIAAYFLKNSKAEVKVPKASSGSCWLTPPEFSADSFRVHN